MPLAMLPTTLLALLLPSLSFSSPTPSRFHRLNKRAINVLTPQWGYTVQYPGNHTQITWTEPTTRDLRIALVRGAPGQLVEVGPYDSFVDNDGQYEWLNEDYDDRDLKSGCDYKFRISIEDDEDDVAESEYFVIVKDGDGGLTQDTMCPGPRGSEAEKVRYGDLAQRAADENENENADDVPPVVGTTSGSGSDNSVSRTTLIIAVVVSDVGILLLLAAVVLFGRRRSWFASRDFLANYVGVVQKAQAQLEGERRPGQMYLKPNGNTSGKEESYVDVRSDGSQQGGGFGSGYPTSSEAGGRDPKIAQLE